MSDDNDKNVAVDWAQKSAEAMNRLTTSPEFTAKYMAWLEYIGPELWTPVAKADYEQMSKENIDPELIAKYRDELESSRVPPAEAKADYEQMFGRIGSSNERTHSTRKTYGRVTREASRPAGA